MKKDQLKKLQENYIYKPIPIPIIAHNVIILRNFFIKFCFLNSTSKTALNAIPYYVDIKKKHYFICYGFILKPFSMQIDNTAN